MKAFICLLLLATVVLAEDTKATGKKLTKTSKHGKRGILGESYGYADDLGGFLSGEEYSALSDDSSSSLLLGTGGGYGGLVGEGDFAADAGYGGLPAYGVSEAVRHVTLDHPVPVSMPSPYPVAVERPVPVPVKVPVHVPVDRPYPVTVPKPYHVTVERPVPYVVQRRVPYPVQVPVRTPVPSPYPVEVPRPYPVTVDRPVPVPVSQPVYVNRPVIVGAAYDGVHSHGFDGHIDY